MTKGDKKTDSKRQAIHRMLESIISENNEDAESALHEYLQAKMHQMINGATDTDEDKIDEQSKESAFSNSGTVMDDDVKGDIKFENGGKKTVKKHGNSSKELDDGIKGDIKFKNGGKKTLKKHDNAAPGLDHSVDDFDDGRKFKNGTTN